MRNMKKTGGIHSRTRSLCPVCLRPVEAFYVQEGDEVFFVKECPDHGSFRVLASECSADYQAWVQHPVVNVAPKLAITAGDPADRSCPLHCGTCDNHLQTACCVLIDLTDRCDQHCPYCFARSERDADKSGEPTLARLEEKFRLLRRLGEERPFNLQLSGGEPTVRDDLPEIIRLARKEGFSYIQINSNGRRLALEDGYAQALKEAGASVIFMQFDGTEDGIYQALRGEPLFEIKKKAIANCEQAGIPVTLVPTIVEGVNVDHIGAMMDFLVEHVNVVKGIHFQPVSFFGRHPQQAEGRRAQETSEQAAGGKAPGPSRGTDGTEKGFCHETPENASGDFPGRITMFGLLRKLEQQRPDFRYEDFCPISTGHTLCCFYSTYIREPDGSVRCTLTGARKEAGVGCCDAAAPATEAQKQETIRKDRDFVLNRWEILSPQERDKARREQRKYRTSEEITSLDEFLRYYKSNTFTVTGMAFQDLGNLDAERVKRCRVRVLSEDDRLIPFCAYNTIYRRRKR